MSGDGEQGSKVVLPEQPASLGPGFLSSYWNTGSSLPRMKGWEQLKYFLLRGVDNVIAIPLSSGITIGTIAVAIFILGGFLLILQNIERGLSQSGTRYEIIAYLSDDLDEDTRATFLAGLKENASVAELEYISKAQALDEFETALGEDTELLEGLAGSNPLPASVEIRITEGARAARKADELVNELRNSELITDVSYVSEWVEQSQELLKVFRFVGVCALVVVVVIVVFLISNTIRLVIFMRRDEIGIMLLVGSSEDAIRIPFMIGGLLQGVIGSIIGLGVLRMAFLLIRSQLYASPVIGVALPKVFFLSAFSVIAVLLVGAGVGCLGSLFALRKFMKV